MDLPTLCFRALWLLPYSLLYTIISWRIWSSSNSKMLVTSLCALSFAASLDLKGERFTTPSSWSEARLKLSSVSFDGSSSVGFTLKLAHGTSSVELSCSYETDCKLRGDLCGEVAVKLKSVSVLLMHSTKGSDKRSSMLKLWSSGLSLASSSSQYSTFSMPPSSLLWQSIVH